jgi:hypothetical protein
MITKPTTVKVTIGSIDDKGLTVSAQYNPAELVVTKTINWSKPAAATQGGAQQGGSGGSGGGGGGGGDEMAQEFTGIEPRTIEISLLFDNVEGGRRGVNVATQIAALEQMASVIDPKASKEDKRRPHHCVVIWPNTLPRFECVIKGLTTTYQMFDAMGIPLRATCKVTLVEASAVSRKKG